MKEIHWTEFYREFYNHSEKTQKRRAEKLLDFGEDGEVLEVAEVFLETDEAFAAEFVKRAVEAGVRFCIDSIWELASFADEETVGHAALQTNDIFTREELEELSTSIDSDSYDELMERYGFDEDKFWEEESDLLKIMSKRVTELQNKINRMHSGDHKAILSGISSMSDLLVINAILAGAKFKITEKTFLDSLKKHLTSDVVLLGFPLKNIAEAAFCFLTDTEYRGHDQTMRELIENRFEI